MKRCDQINEFAPAKQGKVDWQYRIPFSTKRFKVGEEISEAKVYQQLDKCLDELKQFEAKLEKFLESLS